MAMQSQSLYCAFDVGTVSTCLLCATVEDGRVRPLLRRAAVTDLGEGVDKSSELLPAAIERTVRTVADYLAQARELAARQGLEPWCTLTATSAARDARNADDLRRALAELGLCAEVLPGDIEAALGLLGATADFGPEPVLVADIGGGSTELSCGNRDAAGGLVRGPSVSLDVGARRLTERFLACGPDEACDPRGVVAARRLAREAAEGFLHGMGDLPGRLVCVGGTATTVVAVNAGLEPYDADFVHLRFTSADELHELAQRLCRLTARERAGLAGLQPKRAHVIHAGALVLDELVRAGGWDGFTTSESNSLFGVACCMDAAQRRCRSPLPWVPQMVR